MRDWSQESFPLSRALVREVFRDAAALIGKASTTADPAAFCARTIGSLNLDRPPLPQRPKLERRTMYYNVAILLHQTGTRVLARHFPEKGWVEAPANTVIEDFVREVFDHQRAEGR